MTRTDTPQPNVTVLEISLNFWIIIVLTGAGAGLAGALLMKLLRFTQHLSYSYKRGDFLQGVEQVANTRPVVILFLAGILSAIVLYAIKKFLREPSCSVSQAIWTKSGKVPIVETLIQSLLSIITVGMGVSLGREGAIKNAGCIVANKLSDWTRITDVQRHLLVACGVGAGMAAAYNVPLGGALFAAEVLMGSLALSKVVPAFVASSTGIAVSWLLLPNEPAYIFPVLSVSGSLILWALLIGPLMGLISLGYVRALGWAQIHKPKGWQVVVLPIVVFTAIGVVAVKFPQILGNGKNIVQLTFDNKIGVSLLCWLIFLRPLAAVLFLRTGTPGGLFTPTMTFGALLGDGMGQIWNCFAPFNPTSAYALIGSAAFLGAATLGPLSSAAFMLELTRRADSLMVPLLIAIAGATITSRRFRANSIYSTSLLY